MKNIIEIENLSKCYGDFTAVNHIRFQVKKGELFAFLGTNGAGKSTLMKILSGVYSLEEGSMEIFGKKYTSLTPNTAREAGHYPSGAEYVQGSVCGAEYVPGT